MSVISCLCLSLFLYFAHCHLLNPESLSHTSVVWVLLCFFFCFFSFSLYPLPFSVSCLHLLFSHYLCPGHRSVPAHRGSCRSHSAVLDCGWTGRPLRKNKYVCFCNTEQKLLLPDVTICYVHRKSGEWLTLCRQRPGPPPRVSEIANIPTGSCDVFQQGHLGLFSPRVQDSFWGLAGLSVYPNPHCHWCLHNRTGVSRIELVSVIYVPVLLSNEEIIAWQ